MRVSIILQGSNILRNTYHNKPATAGSVYAFIMGYVGYIVQLDVVTDMEGMLYNFIDSHRIQNSGGIKWIAAVKREGWRLGLVKGRWSC